MELKWLETSDQTYYILSDFLSLKISVISFSIKKLIRDILKISPVNTIYINFEQYKSRSRSVSMCNESRHVKSISTYSTVIRTYSKLL